MIIPTLMISYLKRMIQTSGQLPYIPRSVSFCEFGPATTLPNRPSSSPFPIWEWCSSFESIWRCLARPKSKLPEFTETLMQNLFAHGYTLKKSKEGLYEVTGANFKGQVRVVAFEEAFAMEVTVSKAEKSPLVPFPYECFPRCDWRLHNLGYEQVEGV